MRLIKDLGPIGKVRVSVHKAGYVDDDDLREAILGDSAFDKVMVVNDSPHASFLEYGIDPIGESMSKKVLRRYRPYRTSGYDDGPFVENIRHWVEIKFPGYDKVDQDSITYFTVKKLLEKGLEPTFFFSDSVGRVYDRLDRLWDMKDGTMGLAEEIVREARSNLAIHNHNTIYDVHNHFKIRRLKEDD